jgi:hypothetical protein
LQYWLFFKAQEISYLKGVLFVEEEVIGELFPDMFVLSYGVEKGEGFEFPSVACALAFTVGDPSSGDYPSARGYHFSLFNKIDAS